MKSANEFEKVKVSTPISLIVFGICDIGLSLASTLLKQGSRVIIVDYFTKDAKKAISDLKKVGQVDFIDFKGFDDLLTRLNRIDYVYYLLHDTLLQNDQLNSNVFLEYSNFLNHTLKACTKYNSKVSLVTTITLNEKLAFNSYNNYSKPTPYSIEELQKYSETLTAEYHDKSGLNARIIRLGTIIGKENNLSKYPYLEKLFIDSVTKNHLEIEGEGLENHYLIHMSDAIFGILKLTFSPSTNGDVITLCNNHEYTTLSVAYKLLELMPSAVEIKFVPSSTNKPVMHGQYIPAANAASFGWIQKITLEEALKETLEELYEKKNLKWEKEEAKKNEVEPEIPAPIATKQTFKTPLGIFVDKFLWPVKSLFKLIYRFFSRLFSQFTMKNGFYLLIILVLLIPVFYFFLSPIINIAISSGVIYYQGKNISKDISSKDFNSINSRLDTVEETTKKVNENIEKLKWIFAVTKQNELYKNITKLSFSALYATKGANEFYEGAEPLILYTQDFEPAIDFQKNVPTTTREYREYLEQIEENKPLIQSGTADLKIASNYLKDVNVDVFPEFIKKYVVQVKDLNSKYSPQLDTASSFVQLSPELLGLNGRQRYLVILQNQTELRSTGGWISSYVIVGIENGQIRELVVDDVYNLDGALKNKKIVTAAPSDMQTALGITNWSLSTSNWNPDVSESAQNAEYFVVQAEKATDIDGVIFFDLKVIENLLSVWDGIEVTGENELITKDNLYQKIFDMHTDFTPGQSIKAAFLANLSNDVIIKLINSKPSEYKDVYDKVSNSLDEKHILINLKNSSAQQYIEEEGWDGNLTQEFTSAPFEIEWNWGANKANLFLDRNKTLKAEILDQDTIRYTYTLNYLNNSESNTYPEGDYETFTRIYIPDGATIQSISGFRDAKYTINKDGTYSIVGGWFDVPLSASKTFEIKYTIKRSDVETFPLALKSGKFFLDLSIFKQPGANSDKYSIEIVYPDSWSVENSEDFTSSMSTLSKQFILDTEKTEEVAFKVK